MQYVQYKKVWKMWAAKKSQLGRTTGSFFLARELAIDRCFPHSRAITNVRMLVASMRVCEQRHCLIMNLALLVRLPPEYLHNERN